MLISTIEEFMYYSAQLSDKNKAIVRKLLLESKTIEAIDLVSRLSIILRNANKSGE